MIEGDLQLLCPRPARSGRRSQRPRVSDCDPRRLLPLTSCCTARAAKRPGMPLVAHACTCRRSALFIRLCLITTHIQRGRRLPHSRKNALELPSVPRLRELPTCASYARNPTWKVFFRAVSRPTTGGDHARRVRIGHWRVGRLETAASCIRVIFFHLKLYMYRDRSFALSLP